LHLCRVNQKAIGFTTIYKGYSSTRAEVVAVLNDLYVQPQYRGNSYGKELIANALKTAKEMGFSRLQWLTAEDNKMAQKLYNSLGANNSSWFFYTKDT
jgi:ribosomal protein S18 acetylase RimI-like enzyme